MILQVPVGYVEIQIPGVPKFSRSEVMKGCRFGSESSRQTLVSPIFRSLATVGRCFSSCRGGQICDLALGVRKICMYTNWGISTPLEFDCWQKNTGAIRFHSIYQSSIRVEPTVHGSEMPFRTTWHVWNPVNNRILTISTGFTLPETSSLHLKMDDWKTSLVSFWEKLGLFSGANLMLVSGRVFVFMSLQKISAFTSDQTHHGLHLSKVILQQPSSQNNFDLIWQKNTRHVVGSLPYFLGFWHWGENFGALNFHHKPFRWLIPILEGPPRKPTRPLKRT